MTRGTRLLARLRRHPPGTIVRLAVERLHERLGRVAWTLWFRLLAPWRHVRCGRGLEIYGHTIVRSPAGRVVVGDGVQLISSSWRAGAFGVSGPLRLRTYYPTAEIVFDDGSAMTGGSITARSKTIRIGPKTMIGPDCLIADSDFHPAWPPEHRSDYSGDEVDAGVTLGSNVFLGARCIVLKGVTIGDNSVVAAGSVVVKSIPSNSLAAGNPARVVKTYEESP
jgi:acetyltransferase-like isoleucine patch superfamily enzyme